MVVLLQERATALSNAANVPLCRRADLRFFWNRRLAQALMGVLRGQVAFDVGSSAMSTLPAALSVPDAP